jgi:hypothetical protein
LFVDKAAVLDAIGQAGTVIVNALGDDLYKGTGPSRYGRPGPIPGSIQVSAATLVDPAGQGFTTLADAQARFAAKGVTPAKHVIAYCGGGISATIDLFCCTSSATTTSHCMMPRWVSGRATSRYRLKPAERYKSAVIFSIARRAAYGLASPSCLSVS